MIIDLEADPIHARLYDLVDADTGRSMADQPIFYADDEAGIYRVCLKDAKGNFFANPTNPAQLAWEERRGRFRIVLKSQSGEAAAMPGRAESWHDLPSML